MVGNGGIVSVGGGVVGVSVGGTSVAVGVSGASAVSWATTVWAASVRAALTSLAIKVGSGCRRERRGAAGHHHEGQEQGYAATVLLF